MISLDSFIEIWLVDDGTSFSYRYNWWHAVCGLPQRSCNLWLPSIVLNWRRQKQKHLINGQKENRTITERPTSIPTELISTTKMVWVGLGWVVWVISSIFHTTRWRQLFLSSHTEFPEYLRIRTKMVDTMKDERKRKSTPIQYTHILFGCCLLVLVLVLDSVIFSCVLIW